MLARLAAATLLLVGLWFVALDVPAHHAKAEFNGCSAGFCNPPVASGGSGGGCSAATTFIARTSGLSGTESSAYTAMICGMVSDGVGCSAWSGSSGNLDGLYILATNNTTTAALNLCSSSYGLTAVGSALPFTADHGLTGDGGDCLNTNFNPSTAASPNYTQNSASLGTYLIASESTGTFASIGGENTTDATLIWSATLYYDINTTTDSSVVASSLLGSYLNTRTGASATALYHNESSAGTDTTASTTVPNINFFLLARDGAGSCGSPLGVNSKIAAGWIGGSVNGTQAAAIQHRINGYMAALGINTY